MLVKRVTRQRYREYAAGHPNEKRYGGIYCDPCERRYDFADTEGTRCPQCGGPVTCLVFVDPHEVDLCDPALAWVTEEERPVKPPPEVETPYLTAEEAAAYLRITLKALYGLVERRKLSPLPGHRRYRFTREMLDEYLRKG